MGSVSPALSTGVELLAGVVEGAGVLALVLVLVLAMLVVTNVDSEAVVVITEGFVVSEAVVSMVDVVVGMSGDGDGSWLSSTEDSSASAVVVGASEASVMTAVGSRRAPAGVKQERYDVVGW